MKKTIVCALSICAMMMLQSCYVQNISVGIGQDEPVQQVAKVKNHYFIEGLVQPRKDEAKNHVSNDKRFRMKTLTTFWDGFLAGITFGIYTPNTTYYYEPVK
ncbi:MAG: Bor protein [Prevotella sp.]|nr:Bor protein [Prevotella sp.]